jgi:GxxExxY protein
VTRTDGAPVPRTRFSPESEGRDGLTERVIGAAIAVHRVLGPGLLESAYQACLCHELRRAGLSIDPGRSLPIVYDGVQLEARYRLDLVVNDRLVLELKAVDQLLPVHTAQLATYLRLGGFPRGLLINFNVTRLVSGIRRVSN